MSLRFDMVQECGLVYTESEISYAMETMNIYTAKSTKLSVLSS